MAQRRVKGRPAARSAGARSEARMRGRSRIALALVAFVCIAVAVVWRRTLGTERTRELRELESQRLQLEARRADLESDVRDLASRGRLAAVAERRLGMRVPADSQVIILPR